jgi:hypothetical protein
VEIHSWSLHFLLSSILQDFEWIYVAQDTDQWQAPFNKAISLRFIATLLKFVDKPKDSRHAENDP